jgi:TonB family protein
VHSTIYINRTDEYRVVIDALRTATDEDLRHVADERAVDEWVKLPWQATAVPMPLDVVAADAAVQFAGQKRIVCGIVTSATMPSVNDAATHLWLGEKVDGRVDLTIDQGSRGKFGPFLEGDLLSRRACVEGKLVETPAGIVLAVRDAEQFKAVAQPDEARPPAFAPGVSTFASVSHDPGMAAPKLLTVLKPTYTPAAIRAKIQGSVEVEVLVAESGHVTQARIRRSLDPLLGLDDHAVDAAREAEFKPATRNGVPLPVLVVLEMTFKLR